MLIKSGQRIVFIGDSISDYNRARPVGEGRNEGSGTGYIQIVESILNAFDPEEYFRITNMGCNGHNIFALKDRWDRDVLALHPDWVVMLVGDNDVWRQFDSPTLTNTIVPPDIYEREMRALLDRTLPTVKGMILMTPFYLEPLKEDAMRRRMDEYGAIVKRVAGDYKLPCVDLQAMFDEYLTHHHSSFLTWDRVHPNHTGCMLIAHAFLKAVGFDKKIF